MKYSRTLTFPLLLAAIVAGLAIVWIAAGGARVLGVALLLPEASSDGRARVDELSPLLQIREREAEPSLAGAYLSLIQRRHPNRRFLSILGASEAGHHGCNSEHCVTRDLTHLLPAGWNAINLTRRGQTLCESSRFLDFIAGDLASGRFALAITINPIFFAAPGAVFPDQNLTTPKKHAAGGALLADPEWARPGTAANFAANLETELEGRFGWLFLRRALFRHRLGVSPAGPWQSNWLGPPGPALLPGPNLESLRKIKPRRIDWSYYYFPGQGPTPQRSWRSYYENGNIDLDFAGRRMRDLDLNRGRACLANLKERLQDLGAPSLMIRTPLNPGMLRLLDERDGSRIYTATYERFLNQWREFRRSWPLPVYDLDELTERDFVDLDHLSPSGHARLARAIAENLNLP